MIDQIRSEIRRAAQKEKAALLGRFFKTGPGEYAEGDRFIGGSVPALRRIVRTYRDCPLTEIDTLLMSSIHEERFVALQLLVAHFERGDARLRKRIMSLYVRHMRFVNNWDLVDSSAPHIVGAYLSDKERTLLYTFARSRDLWKKRVAIVATLFFIRNGDHNDTYAIAEILLDDEHDLIHKAVGWMLRESGKRDADRLRAFVRAQGHRMPRTMLRSAIEKFSASERASILISSRTHTV